MKIMTLILLIMLAPLIPQGWSANYAKSHNVRQMNRIKPQVESGGSDVIFTTEKMEQSSIASTTTTTTTTTTTMLTSRRHHGIDENTSTTTQPALVQVTKPVQLEYHLGQEFKDELLESFDGSPTELFYCIMKNFKFFENIFVVPPASICDKEISNFWNYLRHRHNQPEADDRQKHTMHIKFEFKSKYYNWSNLDYCFDSEPGGQQAVTFIFFIAAVAFVGWMLIVSYKFYTFLQAQKTEERAQLEENLQMGVFREIHG